MDEALQFLFSTMEDQLTYRCKEPLQDSLLISSDAALADAPGAKSTGGWVCFGAGCALSWGIETIRQQVLSSTEAEYCTAASACKEVISLEKAFKAFRMPFPKHFPVLMDNQSAIALACGPAAHHQRTEHIATKYHLQRQLLLEGIVRYQHQATGVHTSDIFTKDLGKKLHKQHRDVLFGRQPMVFESLKLPHSHKEYVRRYNEEIERKVKEMELSKTLASQAQALKKDSAAALVAKFVAVLGQ